MTGAVVSAVEAVGQGLPANSSAPMSGAEPRQRESPSKSLGPFRGSAMPALMVGELAVSCTSAAAVMFVKAGGVLWLCAPESTTAPAKPSVVDGSKFE